MQSQPKTKNQKPKTKNQKPKTKNQKPKAKSQKPKAKSQQAAHQSAGVLPRSVLHGHALLCDSQRAFHLEI